MSAWFRESSPGCFSLTLHIQPGAKKSECAGLHGDALKIRLAAPPVDGKANAALLEFIADRLGLSKASVKLKNGQTSRRKVVEVCATSSNALAELLA
ncbi:DUF167 domain-containing protein [Dechloromonas sp. ZY10]|uniref:DUF167 domain-containing protein n=1 Tax=Dechloromonas aquae TaxID=2664436 RepID=UPI0035273555